MKELVFRPLCDGRGRWLRWLNQFSRRSGAYVIRKPGFLFNTVLYVGESHTDSLKRTLLRHFQKWTGKTSGFTYARTKVEVAIVATAKSTAIETQNDLISQLQPKDNTLGKDDPDWL
jgi:excinuclease UvrABC nuclease subunit